MAYLSGALTARLCGGFGTVGLMYLSLASTFGAMIGV